MKKILLGLLLFPSLLFASWPGCPRNTACASDGDPGVVAHWCGGEKGLGANAQGDLVDSIAGLKLFPSAPISSYGIDGTGAAWGMKGISFDKSAYFYSYDRTLDLGTEREFVIEVLEVVNPSAAYMGSFGHEQQYVSKDPDLGVSTGYYCAERGASDLEFYFQSWSEDGYLGNGVDVYGAAGPPNPIGDGLVHKWRTVGHNSTVTVYIDGVAQNSTYPSGISIAAENGHNIWSIHTAIGAVNGSGSFAMNGTIYEVRITKGNADNCDPKGETCAGHPTPAPNPTETPTPVNTPSPTPTPTPYSYGTDGAGVVAHWKMQETSGNLVDTVNGITLTAAGSAATYEVSAADPWSNFTGITWGASTSFCLSGNDPDLDIGATDDFVWELVYGGSTSAPQTNVHLLSTGPTLGSVGSASVYYTSNRTIRFYMVTDGGQELSVDAPGMPDKTANAIHKLRIVGERAKNLSIYVDGVLRNIKSMAGIAGETFSPIGWCINSYGSSYVGSGMTVYEMRYSVGNHTADSGGVGDLYAMGPTPTPGPATPSPTPAPPTPTPTPTPTPAPPTPTPAPYIYGYPGCSTCASESNVTAQFLMDESSGDLIDQVASYHMGVAAGTPTYSTSIGGLWTALSPGVTNDGTVYFYGNSDAAFAFGTNDVVIEAALLLDSTGTHDVQLLFATGGAWLGQKGVSFWPAYSGSNARVAFFSTDNTAVTCDYTWTSNWKDSAAHKWRVKWSLTGNATLYVDGVKQADCDISALAAKTLGGNSDTFIGFPSGNAQPVGTIYELRITNGNSTNCSKSGGDCP